jgi:hypothetical protein
MGCVVLIVLSILFEVLGLGTVAWQLGRVQRREFGTDSLASVQSMWRALRGGRFVSRSVTLRAAGGRATARGGIARAGAGRGTTVESRLDALERNQAALDEEIDARFRQQDDRRAALQQSIRAMEAQLRREQDAREDERLTRLRESVAYQWIGTVLFFVGAVLAGVANGVC